MFEDRRSLFLLFVVLFCSFLANTAGAQTMGLEGKWAFGIDRDDKGIADQWYMRELSAEIRLPGSMAQNSEGDDITLKTQWTGTIYDSSFYYNPRMAKYRQPGNIKIPFWLTPAKHYVGPAWYQREVVIPGGWAGKRIVLFLERAHIETRVWVDGLEAGMQNSLVAPHVYDLSGLLSPGTHRLSIRVDNRIKINVGPDSHSITDHTQGNWNGIIGRMELQAGPTVYLDGVETYPDPAHHVVKVKIRVNNTDKTDFSGRLLLSAESFNSDIIDKTRQIGRPIALKGETYQTFEMILPLGKRMQLWDEFKPALYRLTTIMSTNGKEKDQQRTEFGMREFRVRGTEFLINGRPVFLRGTVNACEFPLTGYPAMSLPEWTRIFAAAKAHGLNHMRFHSWCPPEAAFRAADRAGFYIQPEAPTWPNHGVSIGLGQPIDRYIYEETDRMDKWYGDHPAFTMLSAGNEPAGDQVPYLNAFVDHWEKKDGRRIYTGMSVGGSWPIVPGAQYQVRGGVRGLAWDKRPESVSDFSKGIAGFNVPFVAHEMGQWCVFPDFDEIKEYTGVYRAKNLELFREDLNDQGMAGQARDFLMASGRLQVLCYKNEIEKILRTPHYAGFQLLGLQDFPGQGTALVGVLSAFWKEKPYLRPGEFTRFCNSTVPLVQFPKFVYTNNEKLDVAVDVAHFGAAPLSAASFTWTIRNGKEILASGVLKRKMIGFGTGIPVGRISFALSGIKKAAKLNLEIKISGTEFANEWDLWVYPEALPEAGSDVYYTTELDDHAKTILGQGGKVFLNASGKVVKGKEVVMYFQPVFWNTSWFQMKPPHVTGMLIRDQSAAFAGFPTAYYSDLQWWEIADRAQVMNLEGFPEGFRPLVQPIDTWFLNRKLGLIFEAKVGAGKLIVSSADLHPGIKLGRPAARQLYSSLLRYMNSDKFLPKDELAFDVIKDIFISPSKFQFSTHTKDSPEELKPNRKQTN